MQHTQNDLCFHTQGVCGFKDDSAVPLLWWTSSDSIVCHCRQLYEQIHDDDIISSTYLLQIHNHDIISLAFVAFGKLYDDVTSAV